MSIQQHEHAAAGNHKAARGRPVGRRQPLCLILLFLLVVPRVYAFLARLCRGGSDACVLSARASPAERHHCVDLVQRFLRASSQNVASSHTIKDTKTWRQNKTLENTAERDETTDMFCVLRAWLRASCTAFVFARHSSLSASCQAFLLAWMFRARVERFTPPPSPGRKRERLFSCPERARDLRSFEVLLQSQ